jgi:hypothetical protein
MVDRPLCAFVAVLLIFSALGCNQTKNVPSALQSTETEVRPEQANHSEPQTETKISDLLNDPEWYNGDDDRKRYLLGRAVADRLHGHHAHVTSVSWLLIISSPEFDKDAARQVIDDLHDMAKLAGYTEIDIEQLYPPGTICHDQWERVVDCMPVFTWKHYINAPLSPAIPSLK